MPKRQRLLEQWNSYAQKVVPNDAHETQRRECRRAFYAGAVAMNAIVMAGLTPGPGSTAEDERMMIDLGDEMKEFNQMVLEGRA